MPDGAGTARWPRSFNVPSATVSSILSLSTPDRSTHTRYAVSFSYRLTCGVQVSAGQYEKYPFCIWSIALFIWRTTWPNAPSLVVSSDIVFSLDVSKGFSACNLYHAPPAIIVTCPRPPNPWNPYFGGSPALICCWSGNFLVPSPL